MLNIKALFNKLLNTAELTVTQSKFAAFGIMRCGKVVTIRAQNCTSASPGNNTVCKLPEGYRPAMRVFIDMWTPTNTTTRLRMNIDESGVVSVYNYGSSAISGNSNATGTITYVTGN